jgi:hypothetical protein
LFAAQKPGAIAPWSLDEIAAAHFIGKWWEEVFDDMKNAGLLDGKSLAQIVDDYAPQPPRPSRASLESLDTPDRDPVRVETERSAHTSAVAGATVKGSGGRGAIAGLRGGAAGALAGSGKGAGKVAGGIGGLTK